MLRKFLSGCIGVFPFFYRNNYDMKHYPDDIYVNDWKNIGNIIGNIARSTIKEEIKNGK